MSRMDAENGSIDRRDALRRVGALLGGAALIGGSSLVTACQRADTQAREAAAAGVGTFSPTDVAYLDEIAETILPATSTPGAKAAKTGAFMALMVTDSYDEKERGIFREGMKALDAACQTAHGHGFMAASSAERTATLEGLDKEQKEYHDKKAKDDPSHYFRMMKQLSLLGFFTSEVGMTQALRYREAPGRFDPCVPYTKGEKSWAGHA